VEVGSTQVPLKQIPLLHCALLVQLVPSLQLALQPQHVFRVLSHAPP
jgi:hypothetical protein